MDMKKMCGKGKGRGVCAAALQLIEKTVRCGGYCRFAELHFQQKEIPRQGTRAGLGA